MGGELVAIGGREFELGAVYAPGDRRGRQLRRLVAYAPAEGWLGGRVETLIIGRTTAVRPPATSSAARGGPAGRGSGWPVRPRRPGGWTTTSSRRGRGPRRGDAAAAGGRDPSPARGLGGDAGGGGARGRHRPHGRRRARGDPGRPRAPRGAGAAREAGGRDDADGGQRVSLPGWRALAAGHASSPTAA